MTPEVILEMKDISKTFPGVKALDNIFIEVKKGTVHALMGENGAGKSTLMKILYGIHAPDAGPGRILFKGKDLHVSCPRDALDSGLAMIPQEVNPVNNMIVAENVFLGREPVFSAKLPWVNSRKMIQDTQALFDRLGIDYVDPRAPMSKQSIAAAQMISIVTAVSYNADLIIMDEPTSAITEKEVEHLFEIIRKLKEEHEVSIIYISHKLDEVFEIADEVSVLRDGQSIGTKPIGQLTKDTLISMMVGRDIQDFFDVSEKHRIGEVKFEVKNLALSGKFHDVNFAVRKGEILGVAGLMGAGRTEIMDGIFGLIPPESGEIYIDGQAITIQRPQDAIKLGIGFLTEDRKASGIFPALNLEDNMIMADIESFLTHGYINAAQVREACEKQRVDMDIKTPTLKQLIRNLSGGNQQKVLLGRWLLTGPDILILDEPTRGIDVGAKSEIYKLIHLLAEEGKTIIMISSEMPEILAISDRIMVIYDGTVAGMLDRKVATQEKIMQLASGEALEE